jgi:hypothetical protein
MKISILGKLILLFLFITGLFANVTTSVDKTKFYTGDSVTLSIKASGEDVEFPNISSIGGFVVTGTSSSQQISIINGRTSKTKVMQYSFEPTKSITIEPFTVTINNKAIQTKPITIKMIEPTASKASDPLVLEMKTDKASYYVGEPIVVSLYFKYKEYVSIIDAKLEPFEPSGFWKKEIPSPKPTQKGEYVVYQINSLLFANKAGKITIPNHFINVAKRDSRNYINWQKVFSNKLELDIKPLPNNIRNVGDFEIKAAVDKQETNANEPINLTITLKGDGNFDDIKEFTLNLPNQVLYSSKPQVQTTVAKKKLLGEFTQKISIISDKDYTIPPISFSYFDLDSKGIKTIETEPIEIKVKQVQKKEQPKIETLKTQIEPKVITKVEYVEKDSNLKYIYGIGGIFLGVFLTYLLFQIKKPKHQEDDIPLIKRIKKAKEDKQLYDILLPYIQDENIKTYIVQLEKNIYSNEVNKINKKALIEYLKENY